MKPKIYLDTSILLNHLIPFRENEPCSILFEEVKLRKVEIHVSTQNLLDMAYIAGKYGINASQTRRFIQWLLDHTNVGSIDAFNLRDAVSDEDPDLEDSAQLSRAEDAGCDVFVTEDRALCNRRRASGMLIMTPEALLDKMR